MSHAAGMVRFGDKTIMHFEYNGTCDVAISSLWATREEMKEHWRKGGWNECSCGRQEPVEIFTYYGSGFSWEGWACRHCRAITTGFEPYLCDDGVPGWVEEYDREDT